MVSKQVTRLYKTAVVDFMKYFRGQFLALYFRPVVMFKEFFRLKFNHH
jgi:hypothetical protein